jgi:Macrocin-O-methyltransferase (TylF)
MNPPSPPSRSLGSIVFAMTVTEAKRRAGSSARRLLPWAAWGFLTLLKWSMLGVLRRPSVYQPSRLDLLEAAVKAAGPDGLVLEFGVFRGESINFIARRATGRRVFGFDSFEGLPTDWGPCRAGTFSLHGELPPVEPSVTLVKGWFSETLPPFLRENASAVSFLHVDCDLYDSARYVLEQLAERVVPGSVIVFDEFGGFFVAAEQQAFREVARAKGWVTEYLGFTAWGSVAVRVRATAARPSS